MSVAILVDAMQARGSVTAVLVTIDFGQLNQLLVTTKQHF
jgi:hypothetical protein